MMNRIFSLASTRLGRPLASYQPLMTAQLQTLNAFPVTCPSQQQQCRYRSNRSKRGLYDGKDIRSGNNLSFSMNATKRTFKPNIFLKKVYSETLDEMIRFHLTTSALRSIDKLGGLDNYLLSSRHVTSGEGLQVKKRILQRLKYNERHGHGMVAVVAEAETKSATGTTAASADGGKTSGQEMST